MLWFIFPLVLSCTTAKTAPPLQASTADSCEGGETITAVFSYIGYARNEDGIAWGFNLDDHVSEADDEEGCYRADLVDPLGNEGIDNGLAALIPALEASEAVAVESLVQQSINTGNLIMMIEITGVDDWKNDDCVNVGIYRGQGTPLIGTDEVLLDGQSFQRDLSLPHDIAENLKIENGHISAVPLEIFLPVQVLLADIDFNLSGGGIDITLTDDGGMQGFFGGALPITALTDITDLPEVNISEAVVALIASAADLYPNDDGTCEYLSVAFQYEAIPAHFYSLE